MDKRPLENLYRERRARPLSFFSLLFYSSSLFLLCLSLSLLTNEWSDPKRSKSQLSGDDVVWPFSICAFFVHFHSFSVLCTYVFCDVLPLAFLFLLRVEVRPLMIGEIQVKEVMATPSAVPQVWKMSPLLVIWPGKLGNQWGMSSPFYFLFPWLLRTLKLLSFLFPKIPSPCKLSVLPKLCHLSPWLSLR